jgi:hypothetical protein
MSSNIYWTPKTQTRTVGIDHKSIFIEHAEKLFGKFPIELSLDDHGGKVSTLATIDEDWDKLHKILLDNERITLTIEY